jgi:hypothetical protein
MFIEKSSSQEIPMACSVGLEKQKVNSLTLGMWARKKWQDCSFKAQKELEDNVKDLLAC